MASKRKPSDATRSKKSTETSEPAGPSKPGERARDERRSEPSPRYGGGPWEVADERGDRRYGHARNDDADPSELAPHEREDVDDESPKAADPEVAAAEAAGEIEGGGQRAGMHRGDKPRKLKQRVR